MAKTSPLNDDQSDYESSCSSITVPESSRSWMSNLSFGSRRSSISLCSETCPSNQFKPHKANQVAYEAMKLLQREKGGRISLEHFKLLRRVGSGDIGHVYLCQIRNPVVGLPQSFYAMKVVDREALAIRKKLQRADMEKEILGMVDHPFLPTLYATFDASHYSCLVMEFCPGGDLHATRLRQPSKHFTVSSARFYGAETLLALEYLHMMGIVYRDLKPENVLMREDGHIMLSDFDLSLICDVVPRLVKSKVEYAQETVEKNGGKCITPACSLPIQPVLSCFSYSKKTKSKIVTTITENANGEIGKKELNNNNGFQEHHVRDVSSRVSDAGTGLGILSPDVKSRPGPDFRRFRAYSTELVAEPVNARSKSFVGTHEYLAPEVISGQGHGSAVDWWTFGVFLYELIYGKTPFRGENNEKTLINILKQPLTFPRVVMSSTKEYEELLKVQDLISKLLVKNPKKRIGSLRGSVEIKRHEFFRGVNWALIRSVKPPEVPADRQKIRVSRAINMMPRLTKQEKDAPYQIPHHFDYF